MLFIQICIFILSSAVDYRGRTQTTLTFRNERPRTYRSCRRFLHQKMLLCYFQGHKGSTKEVMVN